MSGLKFPKDTDETQDYSRDSESVLEKPKKSEDHRRLPHGDHNYLGEFFMHWDCER